MEIFSGYRVVGIEQDYAAGLFVANLQSIIEKQCDQEMKEISASRRYDYKINRNISWGYLKTGYSNYLLNQMTVLQYSWNYKTYFSET